MGKEQGMDQEYYADNVIVFDERRLDRTGQADNDCCGAQGALCSEVDTDGFRDSGTVSGNEKTSSRDRRPERTGTRSKHSMRTNSGMRVIAITSGKGGVGKTNIVANLGYALSQLGERVLILDADLGLGNLDILLGITPKYNLSHVVEREKTLSEIAVEGPGEMYILPAASGIQEVTQLTQEQRQRLLDELHLYTDSIDVLLIDTAAGISSNVMCFNSAAHEVMVVVSPEPTSITDAYALMKVLSMKYGSKDFRLLVNMVSSTEEAYDVYRQLKLVAGRFLDITIDYLGYVLSDKNVPRCVRRQKVVSELFPASQASQCFYALARKITSPSSPPGRKKSQEDFWNSLLQENRDKHS